MAGECNGYATEAELAFRAACIDLYEQRGDAVFRQLMDLGCKAVRAVERGDEKICLIDHDAREGIERLAVHLQKSQR